MFFQRCSDISFEDIDPLLSGRIDRGSSINLLGLSAPLGFQNAASRLV